MQLEQYLPVVILGLVAVLFAAGTLAASVIFGKVGRRSRTKDSAYECGMLPVGDGNARLSVKFYLVAMLFILFDIEVVFLFPWAVVYREMLQDPATRNLIFGSMISFLGILFVGYLYALKKGRSTGSTNVALARGDSVWRCIRRRGLRNFSMIKFGTSGWRGLIARDFTFENVRARHPRHCAVPPRGSAKPGLPHSRAQTRGHYRPRYSFPRPGVFPRGGGSDGERWPHSPCSAAATLPPR